MAEKTTLPHAYAFTLTYADVDGEPPLGARVFRYQDVKDMWRRIRSAGTRRWGEIELRYVVVGEKGTKYGRCHYHGVMFADRPIHELGELTSRKGPGLVYKRRLNWSIWGHGFVEFQRPDRKGMAYALKYILKGRMNAARSEGHARYGKTEWLASSTLWCSTGRAIGEQWLWDTLREGVEKGRVPSSLRLRVPGLRGDWYIAGPLQRKMCLYLHDVAKDRARSGYAPFAGWKALMQSVAEPIQLEGGQKVKRKAWEWLTYGDEAEQDWETDEELNELWDAERRQQDRDKRAEWHEALRDQRAYSRQRCFGVTACARCEHTRGWLDITKDRQVEKLWKEVYDRSGSTAPFNQWIAAQGLVAFGCRRAREKPEEYQGDSDRWAEKAGPWVQGREEKAGQSRGPQG